MGSSWTASLFSWVNTRLYLPSILQRGPKESTPPTLEGSKHLHGCRVPIDWAHPQAAGPPASLPARNRLSGTLSGPSGTCSQECHSCFQHKHIPAPLKQILLPSENKGITRGCISAQQVGIKQNHEWSRHYTVKRSSIITENSWNMFQDIELQNFRAGKEIRYY